MWLNILAMGAITFFSLRLLGIGVLAIRKGARSRHWLQTPATVLASSVDRIGSYRYEPSVEFKYAFNGEECEGWRLRPYPSATPFRENAARTAARYTPGQRVVAFVDPSDSDEAVLEPGLQSWSIWVLLFGLVGSAWAGYFFVRDLALLIHR